MVKPSVRNIAVHTKDVLQVRVGRFQSEPPITRIVIDLGGPRSFDVVPSAQRVIVRIKTEDAATLSSPFKAAPTPTSASLQAPIVPSDKPAFVQVNTEDEKKFAVAQFDPGPDANSRASTCCCSDEASYCAGQDRRRREIAAEVSPGSDTESCASSCCGSGETSGGADQERRRRKVVTAAQSARRRPDSAEGPVVASAKPMDEDPRSCCLQSGTPGPAPVPVVVASNPA